MKRRIYALFSKNVLLLKEFGIFALSDRYMFLLGYLFASVTDHLVSSWLFIPLWVIYIYGTQ